MTSAGARRRWRAREAGAPWDPIADYAMMRRFVDAYMQLWRSPKPVIAQVHGFCVAGGTDFALCSDLIVCADDCRIGYPPARVWGSPTTAMWMYRLGLERTKRLLLTGDPIDGRSAVEWGLASEAVPAAELDASGWHWRSGWRRFRPTSSHMMKLLVNQTSSRWDCIRRSSSGRCSTVRAPYAGRHRVHRERMEDVAKR